MRSVAQAPRLKVGLVQPNIAYSNDADFSRGRGARARLTRCRRRRAGWSARERELVVWSEGSYPAALPREFNTDFPSDSAAMIRRGLGGVRSSSAPTPTTRRPSTVYNSAHAARPHGAVTGRYDKVRLLAFGEYIPGRRAVSVAQAHRSAAERRRFTAGAGPRGCRFATAAGTSLGLGPVICYEDILPEYLVQVGRLASELAGEPDRSTPGTAHSTEPWEHLALAVFATVELRDGDGARGELRRVGAHRSQRPAWSQRPPRTTPTAAAPAGGLIVGAPRLAGGQTVFVRFGGWFPYLACGHPMDGYLREEGRARSRVVDRCGC